MVGLTFVRGGLGEFGIGIGAGSPAGAVVPLTRDWAFATSGRFGEVFSKLRAGYVALAGGGGGALAGARSETPLALVVAFFLGTRCVIKSVETRLDLDTLRNGPEIHVGVDFHKRPVGRPVKAGTSAFGLRAHRQVNNTYGASVP
jgi:hypothetical protein